LPVSLRFFTDPACPASWASEPALRKLVVEFGDEVQITYVMGGLARELEPPHEARLLSWLDAARRSGMPIDPRLWSESPIRSTYPACMAAKAAAEQGAALQARYLRALREGLMCFARRLDTSEPLVELAREAGLDVARFRIDLDSNAIVEAFGADLEATRAGPYELPSFELSGGGATLLLEGPVEPAALREAALRAGARPAGAAAPDALEALRRFGRMAAVEVAAVCDLPGPRANAELWRLAAEWQAKPIRVLTGELFELFGG
jgi:predicted DsbA family dithiol-disulfide isomerase